MNKTLTYLLSGAGLLLSQVVCGQTLARGTLLTPQGTAPTQATAAPQSLRQSLQQLETRYKVSILADAQLLEGKIAGLQPTGKLEDALRALLKPHRLTFDKIDERIYVVVGKGAGRRRAAATQPAESTLPVAAPQPAGEQEPDATPNRLNSNSNNDHPTDRSLTGRVTTETGEGLPGVSVLTKGTTRGTTTDGEGRYRLSIPDGGATTLVFSFVGYLTQEVAVGNRSTLDVRLLPDDKTLGEVVVVGYGTVKRSDVTGSVASVKAKELENIAVPSVESGLQGRVAGVQIVQSSGAPGAPISVRVRGGNSISAGNEPLYVIDGFPVYGNNGSFNPTGARTTSLPQNPLASINASDIESIDVLKDASATAIYGARGANGVVIITTKRGKEGRANVDSEAYYGFQEVTKQIDLLTAEEHTRAKNEQLVNLGFTARYGVDPRFPKKPEEYGVGTNWQDEIFRTAPIQNYQVSVSGGNEKIRYWVSGNHLGQDGVIIGSNFKRYSGRINLDAQVSRGFRLGSSLVLSHTLNNQSVGDGQGDEGVLRGALYFSPAAPVRDAAGNYSLNVGAGSGFTQTSNPVALALDVKNQIAANRTLGSVFGELDILPKLKLRVNVGFDLTNSKRDLYFPSTLYSAQVQGGIGSASTAQTTNLINENLLTYSARFSDRHQLTVIGGVSWQQETSEGVYAESRGFINDNLGTDNLGIGSTPQPPGSFKNRWGLNSYFTRLNYSLNDRYLFTFTARSDGSSRFGESNKYGFFPSGAFAWRVSEEKFFPKSKAVSDLKIRLSYGLTGNQEIGLYNALSAYNNTRSVRNDQIILSVFPQRIANPDLRWERTAQFDAGIDASFLNGRFSLTTDFYRKVTQDLLLNVNIPTTSGFGSSLQNVGSLENYGVELGITSTNVKTAIFDWSTILNVSGNRNQVLELGGSDQIILDNVILRRGESVGSFYGVLADGIWQSKEEIAQAGTMPNAVAGDRRYKDLNGDGKFNAADDRTILGNGLPKFIYGLTNNIRYKGLDFSLFIQGVQGNKILNSNRQRLGSGDAGYNMIRESYIEAWRKTAPSNTYPELRLPSTLVNNTVIEDGSYLRIRALTLGYTLPKFTATPWLRSVRVYLTGQNLFTFTNYSWYDPEVNAAGQSNVVYGLDNGSYPVARTYLLGVRVGF